MVDAASRLGLRQALYHRLHWLWPILALPLLRRTVRVALWGLLAAWLIFAALVLALRYFVLPNIGAYHTQIEQALSGAVGQPVTIGRIEARWQGLNPDIVLDDVVLSDRQGVQVFSLEQMETVISWRSLWHGKVTLASLIIERPVLHVRREATGRITVAGIEAESEGDSAFSNWVLEQPQIRIRNATIVWEDRLRGAPQLVLEDLQFGLDNKGRRHLFGLSAAPPSELAARIDVRGEVTGDIDDALENFAGRVYVQLDYADLAGWRNWVDYPVDLTEGRGALRFWGDLADGKGKVTTDLALDGVRVRLGKKLPELELESLRGRLEGSYKTGAWTLGGSKLELQAEDGLRIVPTDFQVAWQQDARSGRVTGSASASILDLTMLARLAAYLPLDARSRDLLERHKPKGRLAGMRAGWGLAGEALEQYSLRAAFTDLGLLADGYFPGAHGLAGQVEFDEKGGALSLDAGKSGISLPAVFVEPDIAFDQLRARATWKHAAGVVDVKLERLQFDGADVAGSANGSYHYTGSGPGTIDLGGAITRADGRAVWRYIPSVVGSGVRDWLRSSIVSGRGYDAKLVLKGNLADFPFRDPATGKFLITAKAEGVKLDYADGWPHIDDIKADMSFGVGMRIVAEKGSILGAKLNDVEVEIPDFDVMDEMLLIRGGASGPTDEFLRFIELSPVGDKIDNFTRGMKATGNGKLELALDLPIRRLQDTKVRGEFQLQKNDVYLFEGMPPVTQASGRLLLTESSITSSDLVGRIFGGPLRVGIRSHADKVAVQVAGTSNVAELAKHLGMPPGDRVSGSTAWKAGIDIKRGQTDLVVDSDLLGVTSHLPEPLAKAAATPLALRVEKTTGDGGRQQFKVRLGDAAQALAIRRGDTMERAVVVLGSGEARLPDSGVALRIAVPRFDADAWQAMLGGNGSARGGARMPALDSIAIKAPVLRLMGRDFTQVSAEGRPRDEGWQIALVSDQASGDLFWRTTDGGWLEGRLGRLVVRSAAETAESNTTLVNSLPGMNLTVDDFRIGDIALGRLELRARNDRGAWHLETLNLRNPDGALTGKAVWNNDGAGRHQTRLDFELTASDVGRLLTRLGYVDAIRRGTAMLAGHAQWNGPLTGIHYPSLSGQLSVIAENGQFNKLEPGVGRLLGLISLQSLPRRLTLDFRDIFSDGLAFDSIEGKTTMTAGVMRIVDALRINSPAAQIEIRGEADMKNETQNLQVLVRPQMGAVAAIGTALINPIAGAAALVASTVLQNPIGRLFSYRYHVTGSWSDPKVEKVGEFVEEVPLGTSEGGRR